MNPARSILIPFALLAVAAGASACASEEPQRAEPVRTSRMEINGLNSKTVFEVQGDGWKLSPDTRFYVEPVSLALFFEPSGDLEPGDLRRFQDMLRDSTEKALAAAGFGVATAPANDVISLQLALSRVRSKTDISMVFITPRVATMKMMNTIRSVLTSFSFSIFSISGRTTRQERTKALSSEPTWACSCEAISSARDESSRAMAISWASSPI